MANDLRIGDERNLKKFNTRNRAERTLVSEGMMGIKVLSCGHEIEEDENSSDGGSDAEIKNFRGNRSGGSNVQSKRTKMKDRLKEKKYDRVSIATQVLNPKAIRSSLSLDRNNVKRWLERRQAMEEDRHSILSDEGKIKFTRSLCLYVTSLCFLILVLTGVVLGVGFIQSQKSLFNLTQPVVGALNDSEWDIYNTGYSDATENKPKKFEFIRGAMKGILDGASFEELYDSLAETTESVTSLGRTGALVDIGTDYAGLSDAGRDKEYGNQDGTFIRLGYDSAEVTKDEPEALMDFDDNSNDIQLLDFGDQESENMLEMEPLKNTPTNQSNSKIDSDSSSSIISARKISIRPTPPPPISLPPNTKYTPRPASMILYPAKKGKPRLKFNINKSTAGKVEDSESDKSHNDLKSYNPNHPTNILSNIVYEKKKSKDADGNVSIEKVLQKPFPQKNEYNFVDIPLSKNHEITITPATLIPVTPIPKFSGNKVKNTHLLTPLQQTPKFQITPFKDLTTLSTTKVQILSPTTPPSTVNNEFSKRTFSYYNPPNFQTQANNFYSKLLASESSSTPIKNIGLTTAVGASLSLASPRVQSSGANFNFDNVVQDSVTSTIASLPSGTVPLNLASSYVPPPSFDVSNNFQQNHAAGSSVRSHASFNNPYSNGAGSSTGNGKIGSLTTLSGTLPSYNTVTQGIRLLELMSGKIPKSLVPNPNTISDSNKLLFNFQPQYQTAPLAGVGGSSNPFLKTLKSLQEPNKLASTNDFYFGVGSEPKAVYVKPPSNLVGEKSGKKFHPSTGGTKTISFNKGKESKISSPVSSNPSGLSQTISSTEPKPSYVQLVNKGGSPDTKKLTFRTPSAQQETVEKLPANHGPKSGFYS